MSSFFTRILQPVQRQGSERYLRLTLMAFAASVILTRLFLSLTGYPQVGGGTLHIAHLLWGGLLLFIAALLPLIFANRWVYTASGLGGGIGVGLFIDEVGKFITRSNDYFYPAAAPIIYAFFLLTVILYVRVGRTPGSDPRAELYRVFDDMSEVLDHDLDRREREDLEARLQAIANRRDQPDYARLAAVLLEFLDSPTVRLTYPTQTWLSRLVDRSRKLERRIFTPQRFRSLLIAGLLLVGLFSLVDLARLAAPGLFPGAVAERADIEQAAGELPAPGTPQADFAPLPFFPGPKRSPAAAPTPGSTAAPPAGAIPGTSTPVPAPETQPTPGDVATGEARTFRATVALWLRAGLEAMVGVLLLASAYFLLARQDARGVIVGIFSLLLALTTVNLLVFYFDQFGAVVDALLQFALYRGLVRYRKLYLNVPGPGARST